MQISIRGGSKTQKKYTKDIIRFCGEKLMSKRLAKGLTIKVHFIKGLLEDFKQETVCGKMTVIDPRSFFLRLIQI